MTLQDKGGFEDVIVISIEYRAGPFDDCKDGSTLIEME
jgi:hypothetical protein